MSCQWTNIKNWRNIHNLLDQEWRRRIKKWSDKKTDATAILSNQKWTKLKKLTQHWQFVALKNDPTKILTQGRQFVESKMNQIKKTEATDNLSH